MAEQFIFTTGGWSTYYLNDTPSSRRPWLFRKEYATIDKLLSKHSQLTNFRDRRHPEEFSAAFNQRMKGTWSLPKRNSNFTGRQCELDDIQSRFCTLEMGRQCIVRLDIVGMGGVGKTQLVTEYCYLHFPSKYGLVVYLNAQTIDTLITDYRSLLTDLVANTINENSSIEEILSEVRTRLYRSNIPWLMVFDNLEDHSILERFVPNGTQTRGHVLVTTRHQESNGSSDGVLTLGCLDNDSAIELLRRSAGTQNIVGLSNVSAAAELCQKLGGLPLALSMAAAYMRQCDVQCSEYLNRYSSSEKQGQNLLQRGKLQDYSETVASSMSMILPTIQDRSQTTSDVLHLVAYLAPDGITKMLFRILLNEKKIIDDKIIEKKLRATKVRKHLSIACVLVGGVVPCMMSATSRQRISICAVMTAATASSIYFFNQGPYSDYHQANTKPRRNFSISAFEYEESDNAWDILKSFSLLSVKEGKGSMHRLLQQAMRIQPREESLYYITICVRSMLSCWKFQAENTETWRSSLLLLEHVKSVVSHANEYDFQPNVTLEIARLSKEAGILSSMALNAFVEAQSSLELALEMLERSKAAKTKTFRIGRASTLHELSKVFRYQGQYEKAHTCLKSSLELNNSSDCLTADILHELGILDVKQHKLDSATLYLEKSLSIRRGLDDRESTQNNASSTLHQLAAIQVARKPPHLYDAKILLEEALQLSTQIGQRAATIKQLARVSIRQGDLSQAESYLEQALHLYLELYDNSKLHINVAAVQFQQGALALQQDELEEAEQHFLECLRVRRHVYSYACNIGSDDVNPTHLEVACVLHEIGHVQFAQERFTHALETLQDEKAILERLDEASSSSNSVRIYQARLNNLTWLQKCSKEMGDDDKASKFAHERNEIKKHANVKSKNEKQGQKLHCESISLQRKIIQCRVLARRFALENKKSRNSCQDELMHMLEELSSQIRTASSGPMRQAAVTFHDAINLWIDKSEKKVPILNACDQLRDVLRAHGVQVNDSSHQQ